MSTFLEDLEKSNPKLAEAYKIVGNQDRTCLKNMIRALSMMTVLNSQEDWKRLKAAKYILNNRKG